MQFRAGRDLEQDTARLQQCANRGHPQRHGASVPLDAVLHHTVHFEWLERGGIGSRLPDRARTNNGVLAMLTGDFSRLPEGDPVLGYLG